MSVSVLNQPATQSVNNDTQKSAPSGPARPHPSSGSQQKVGVTFNSPGSQSGLIFDSASRHPVPGHGHFRPGPPPRPLPEGVRPNPGPPPRPLPEGVRPNPGPPPRPNPSLPDPHYSKRSGEQLAEQLLKNYTAFRGPWPSREVTTQSVHDMAARPLTGYPHIDSNIRLAREMVRRPELMQALDRNGRTGGLDNRLSRDDISSYVRSDNPLKLATDKEMVSNVLRHFDALKGGFWNGSIKLSTFERLASKPLTGDPRSDHLIQLSREVMARSDLGGLMDNIFGPLRDGKATRSELLRLLNLLG